LIEELREEKFQLSFLTRITAAVQLQEANSLTGFVYSIANVQKFRDQSGRLHQLEADLTPPSPYSGQWLFLVNDDGIPRLKSSLVRCKIGRALILEIRPLREGHGFKVLQK